MKKIILTLTMAVLMATAFSQSEKYMKTMQDKVGALDSTWDGAKLKDLSAAFERIADAEKTQWLPYYYASLSQVLYAFMKNDMPNNDGFAGKAETLLTKAEGLQPNNSEISCIKSMIATLRMLVNPQVRWQQYGATIQQELDNAKKQDPNNPRPYYLQGQNIRNTPEQFGGGCNNAKPLLEEAVKKYEAFKPESNIAPSWGKAQAQQVLATCK